MCLKVSFDGAISKCEESQFVLGCVFPIADPKCKKSHDRQLHTTVSFVCVCVCVCVCRTLKYLYSTVFFFVFVGYLRHLSLHPIIYSPGRCVCVCVCVWVCVCVCVCVGVCVCVCVCGCDVGWATERTDDI